MTTTTHLLMFTVYRHPIDYPTGYVVRPWEIHSGGGGLVMGARAYGFKTLELARLWLQSTHPHLTPIARSPDDEPQVVESWV